MSEYSNRIEADIEQAKNEKNQEIEKIKQEAEGLLKKAIEGLDRKDLLDLDNGTEVNTVINMKDSESYEGNPQSFQSQLEVAIGTASYEGKFKITYRPVMVGESEMKIVIVKKAETEAEVK